MDAEGNFILNQHRARFKIDSYDYAILAWMVRFLEKEGIKSKFRCIARKGMYQHGGLRWKNDLWRLNINEATSLKKFIESTLPFLRHESRIRDVEECLVNIQERITNGTITH